MDLDNNAHSVFLLYYHLIMVVKYRRKVIDDRISNRAKEIFEYIAPRYGITLEEWNHDVDHVHVMFRAQPKSEISKFINAYKSASSRLLKKEYQATGKLKRTTPAAYKKEYPWLKEVDSLALANVQLHLEIAYKNFFANPSTGFPKFKSRHRSKQSYTTNVVNRNIRLENGKLHLPKLKEVRIRVHREIPKEYLLKSVTVSREASGKYYASLLYEYECCENQAEPEVGAEPVVLGIDYAMSGMAVFSDGTRCTYPGYFRKSAARLAREQRKLSRCQKGSRNYEKQKKKVAICHEKIRNQRKDFHHKLSHKLAETYDAIAVEDLNMKAMSQCLHLGKGIMDNGYGMFLDMLSYKLEERGKKLIRIDRYYPSSKTCSRCGRIKKELSLSERIYDCECGNHMDRDVNAAINIREEGKRMMCA